MARALVKQPAESRLYSMDFRHLMTSAETISTIASTTVSPTTLSPLLIASSAISGQKVQLRLTGGLDGTEYKVTVRITTSSSNTLEGEGDLEVTDL
jgi:hypothetical protein